MQVSSSASATVSSSGATGLNAVTPVTPLGDTHTAVVLGRPGPEFRPSEVARLGYLAGIVATMLR